MDPAAIVAQLQSARQEVVESIFPVAPESYRRRIWVQIGLAGFLCLQSAVYLLIWLWDAKQRQKSWRPIRLQRAAGGRLVVVQALYVYTFMTMLSGAIILYSRYRNYRMHFAGGSWKEQYIFAILTWTPASFSALAFTFSNFSATIMITKQGRSFETAGPIWVFLHNTAFIVLCLGWLCCVIPLGARTNATVNDLVESGGQTIAIIDGVLLNPATLSLDILGKLQLNQERLIMLQDRFLGRYRASTALVVLYCGFYACAGAFSLYFVLTLRQQSAWNKRQHYPSKLSGSIVKPDGFGAAFHTSSIPEQEEMSTDIGRDMDLIVLPPSSNNQTKDQATVMHQNRDTETAALHRLARDLTLSVPVVLLLAIYFPICGGLCVRWFSKTAWTYQEFRLDLFSWPECCLNIMVMAFFTINYFKHPGRNGAHQGYSRSLEQSGSGSRSGTNTKPVHTNYSPPHIASPYRSTNTAVVLPSRDKLVEDKMHRQVSWELANM